METSVADNAKIGEITSLTRIGMLTAVQTNGELRSRPMLILHSEAWGAESK
jgi:hypothetical protein